MSYEEVIYFGNGDLCISVYGLTKTLSDFPLGYYNGLEIFIDPSHPPRAVKPENLGLRQLSLRVDNLERTVEELELEAGPIMNDWVGVRFCFVADPDGLPVQLHE